MTDFEPDWWNHPRMRAYRAWLWLYFKLPKPIRRPVAWVWRKIADRGPRWRKR